MSKLRILVIGGGPSREREISLLSSKAVFDALQHTDYDTTFYDWDGTPQWLINNLSKFDLVLPVLHGEAGEDGQIQKLLEQNNVRYLGSNSEVSRLCFDKQAARQKLTEIEIRVPEGQVVSLERYSNHLLRTKPHVLKPFDGGSSIDTYILPSGIKDLTDNIAESFERYEQMLLEEYIDGTEITVSLLNGEAMPVIEIQPPKNGTFDYINKYNGKTLELCPPENLSTATQKVAQNIAKKIYTAFGCRHLARIDMIVLGDDIYTLEVNTLPGMTSQSLYPKSLAVAGYDFDRLVATLITLVNDSTSYAS